MSEMTETEPSTSPASSGLPFAVKIIGGFVLVAIVVGIGLIARELTGDDELTLPDELGGLAADDSDAALDQLNADDRDQARDNARSIDEYNSERLSEAFDGAEAVTRRYGTLQSADESLLVSAVRAESGPPLPVAFDDPEYLHFAAPRNELVEEGDVTCLLTRDLPPLADGDDEPSEEDLVPTTVLCQRTGNDLTVRVFSSPEPDLDEIVDITDEVWEELS
jgi:hypothetical protein